MSEIKIRNATVEDATELLKIYSYYVEKTAISFEIETPTLKEFEDRIVKIKKNFPYIVAEVETKIVGYAYAHEFVGREAYKFSAELTIYLDKNFRTQGIGKKLYSEIEKILKERGIKNLYACIAYCDVEDEYLNLNSVKFHEHLGFKIVGKFTNCGYKFNRHYSMVWAEKLLSGSEI
ncbi:MAG: N-acetyltransferase [Selenomonadaceae bacterium]|nr:N-acetyltransferase [Selenomonadaceae bacterium]